MKIRSSKKSSKSRRSILLDTTVEYVSFRTVQFRSDNGQKYNLPVSECPGLMPGDRVSGRIRQHRGRKSLDPATFRVEPCNEIQVVVRIRRKRVAGTEAKRLSSVGLIIPGSIQCSNEDLSGLEHGQHVVVTLSRQPRHSRTAAIWKVSSIDRVLNSHREIAAAVALSRYGIRSDWPIELTAELESLGDGFSSGDLSSRRDLRDLPFVTIDPESASDFDDALYCQRLNSHQFRLRVAIADVAQYVQASTALDSTALERGASIYFPGWALPMLPHGLSSDICSIVPREDRLAIVCDMFVTADGLVDSFEFYEAIIQSQARLRYEEVERTNLDGQWTSEVVKNLRHLFEVHDAFSRARNTRGVLSLDLPEAVLEFDCAGQVNAVNKTVRLASHSLVEEAMLAANTCAAKFLSRHFPAAAMYRVHDSPSPDDLLMLSEILNYFDVDHELTNESTAADYQHIAEQLKNRHHRISVALQMHLLRSLATAVYSPDQQPHFALNYSEYTHFTSPIRRYPDLLVHRMIKQVLRSQINTPDASKLRDIAMLCSYRERRAESCSRDAEQWLKAEFMQSYVGEQCSGIVVDVRNFGIFIQLDSPYVDGMVHVSELGGEYFQFEERSRCLVGSISGRIFEIGQHLTVEVTGANPQTGHIDFELV